MKAQEKSMGQICGPIAAMEGSRDYKDNIFRSMRTHVRMGKVLHEDDLAEGALHILRIAKEVAHFLHRHLLSSHRIRARSKNQYHVYNRYKVFERIR